MKQLVFDSQEAWTRTWDGYGSRQTCGGSWFQFLSPNREGKGVLS